MYNSRLIAFTVTLLAYANLSACGSLKMERLSCGRSCPSIEGAFFQMPETVVVESKLTQLLVPGQPPSSNCAPVKFQEIAQMVLNPDAMYRVWYDPGFLETAKFSVTYANGGLAGVNAEPLPQAPQLMNAIGSLLTASVGAAVALGAPAPAGAPTAPCNGGKTVESVVPIADFMKASSPAAPAETTSSSAEEK